jgi:hypothetical protein
MAAIFPALEVVFPGKAFAIPDGAIPQARIVDDNEQDDLHHPRQRRRRIVREPDLTEELM